MYEKKKTWKIQVEGPGAEWARNGFSDGGFETGITAETFFLSLTEMD